MRATWVLTVASDRNSRWAISVLDNARATSSKTSCSRGVSASRAASAGRGGAPSPCTYRSSSRRVTAGATTASPAATARMAESRSGGPTSLSRKPLAPARKPAMTYSSKSKVEDEHAGGRRRCADPAGRLDAIELGHSHVHQHYVGLELMCLLDRGQSVVGFT